MKKLSAFDIGLIIAFAVITVAGIGGWYYFSGQLAAAQQDDADASADFDKYSSRMVYLPNAADQKILEASIEATRSKLDPVIKTRLEPETARLADETGRDPVKWKHELDTQVSTLNASAKTHGITVPPNFYYGFSRYLSPTPGEDQTVVLTKQLRAIEELANILINAPVKAISGIRRTYEEDGGDGAPGGNKGDVDRLVGRAGSAPGNLYTAYPLEVDFDATTTALRRIINDLTKSPLIFVVRNIAIQNTRIDSPQVGDLEKMAGPPPDAVTDSVPGEVAAKSTKGPQFLFGNEYLHVHLRIDLIDWTGVTAASENEKPARGPRGNKNNPGANP